MQVLEKTSANEPNICTPLPNYFQNQIDFQSFNNLIISISQKWNSGQESKGKSRSILWNHFFLELNHFIYNIRTNSLDFHRCLQTGALIF